MGKYGLGNKSSNDISDLSYRRNVSHDNGVDEVDNVKRQVITKLLSQLLHKASVRM